MTPWLRVPGDWRRPEVAGSYELFWSRKGRFGQLYPRPTPSEVAAFYEVEYYTHGGSGPAVRPRSFLEKMREHLAWRLDSGSDITAEGLASLVKSDSPAVLEIGCGDGKLLAAMRGLGWSAVGIEPDPAARRVSLDRGLEVHPGTAEEPPAEIHGRAFDVVVLQHVLEHCLDPIQALRLAATHLKPHGAVVVETPNNDAAGLRQAGVFWPWLDVPRHLNFFTTHSLQRACTAAGLVPVKAEYTGYTRQFQGPWLDMERHIRTTLSSRGTSGTVFRSWSLLARTALASPRSKYDSVRIIARPGSV